MKVLITDAAVLAAVRLSRIRSYLARHHWSPQSADTEVHVLFWSRSVGGGEPQEVVVPKSESYRDYPERIAELLADLTRYENRSQLFILRNLQVAPWWSRRGFWILAIVGSVALPIRLVLMMLQTRTDAGTWSYVFAGFYGIWISLVTSMNIALLYEAFRIRSQFAERKEPNRSSEIK